MTQTAEVRRTIGEKKTEVTIQPHVACGHNCDGCGNCHLQEQPTLVLTAETRLDVQPGETVTIQSASWKVLAVAAAVYLLPLLVMITLYCVVWLLEPTHIYAWLAGVFGFLAGVGILFGINHLVGEKLSSAVQITRKGRA